MQDAYTWKLASYSRTLVVTFHRQFDDELWKEFTDFFMDKLREGQLKWDLDLRELDFIHSRDIGLIIGLNANLTTQNGNLRLVISKDKGQKITRILRLTRVDQILDLTFE